MFETFVIIQRKDADKDTGQLTYPPVLPVCLYFRSVLTSGVTPYNYTVGFILIMYALSMRQITLNLHVFGYPCT